MKRKTMGLFFTMACVLLCWGTGSWASGAFAPPGKGSAGASFNKGKAIYSGRKGSANCAGCHKTFKRASLKNLGKPVSAFIESCDSHKPCFSDTLSDDDLKAINSYFSKRYRL